MNKIKKNYKIIILICVLILVDQILKIVVLKNNNTVLLEGILKFSVVENIHGNYGVNSDSTVIYIITNLIIIMIAFKFMTNENQFVDKKMRILLALIIAGGISNSLDRLFRGYVVEFIDFTDLIKLPIFNLADIYGLFGWILIVAIFANFTAKEIKDRNKAKKE